MDSCYEEWVIPSRALACLAKCSLQRRFAEKAKKDGLVIGPIQSMTQTKQIHLVRMIPHWSDRQSKHTENSNPHICPFGQLWRQG